MLFLLICESSPSLSQPLPGSPLSQLINLTAIRRLRFRFRVLRIHVVEQVSEIVVIRLTSRFVRHFSTQRFEELRMLPVYEKRIKIFRIYAFCGRVLLINVVDYSYSTQTPPFYALVFREKTKTQSSYVLEIVNTSCSCISLYVENAEHQEQLECNSTFIFIYNVKFALIYIH